MSREDLKALCEPHADVKYVEFERGQPKAYVRFEDDKAPVVLEALGAKVKVADCDQAEVTLLEGDDEAAYWLRADSSYKARRSGGKRKAPAGKDAQRKKNRK